MGVEPLEDPMPGVLLTTLRISLVTTAIAAVLAYPVALVMVRSKPTIR